MMTLDIFAHSLWQTMTSYVFYYPLFMSSLWIMGAIFFYLKNEKPYAKQLIPMLEPHQSWPGVTILIPCCNEGANAIETIAYAINMDYPEFEIIAINDGSKDDTLSILHSLAKEHPKLKVVNLIKNQGKALGLQAGALLAKHDYLICIDGDALIDKYCVYWMMKHFIHYPEVAAVTGNPRIRNRTSLLGKIQVGEFSSIVGLIKRAQRTFGRLFTVSGVITAFRKTAVHDVGYWSPDMLTEDIDITWKLQRTGWDVHFEPKSLAWILMPETLKGLWNQRLRWAMGGVQVMLKNINVLFSLKQTHLWALMIELMLSMIWAYSMVVVFLAWGIHFIFSISNITSFDLPLFSEQSGVVLISACLIQFAVSKWLDGHYDQGLGKNYFWLIWYPFIYWVLNLFTAVAALPKVLWGKKTRARWVSPDRGVHQQQTKAPNSVLTSNSSMPLKRESNTLIINNRHELPLSRRFAWDLTTLLLWSGWLYLWKSLFMITYGIVTEKMPIQRLSHLMIEEINIASLAYAALLLITTPLILYALSKTNRSSRNDTDLKYEPNDYATYFRLNSQSLQEYTNSQVINVHHDNLGRIIQLSDID